MALKVFKLSAKSQITVPGSVRKMLGVGPGELVQFVVEDGRVVLLPAREQPVSLWDIGKKYRTVPPQPVGVAEMNQAIDRKRRQLALKKR